MTPPFKLGQLLHDRYLIQLDLGQGRLSRNYLADDTHRFDEPCLVKVFSPDPNQSITVEDALDLFQQQARTLYCLDHPQVANFREFFQLASPDHPQFYLVQDFIEGQTYQDLSQLRRGHDSVFTEGEVKQLLRQLLPVLSYLHSQGVFHRQLTPANIVRREIDGLPMLVGFSDAPTDELTKSADCTEISLAARPEDDLFCLGLCGLSLLSGRKPLFRAQSRPAWQAQLDPLPLSQEVRDFLLKLLMRPPEVGFTSAAQGLEALENLLSNSVLKAVEPLPQTLTSSTSSPRALPQPLFADNESEPAITPEALPPHQSKTPPQVTRVTNASKLIAKSALTRVTVLFSQLSLPKSMIKSKGATGLFKKMLLLLGLMAIATGIGWGTGKVWLMWKAQAHLKAAQNAPPPPKTPLDLKNDIRTRRLNLGLSVEPFQALVNDWLGFKLNQIPANPPDPAAPPPGTEEEQLKTAIALLTTLETLSPEALNLLSQNTSALGDRRRWIPRVNQLRLSSRSFNDLVNARFRHYFPDINPDDLGAPRSGSLRDRPLEQLWNALAFESLISLEDGSHYQRVSLADESSLSLSGQFNPGKGYAYAINIPQGQS
ncbi:MAG: serine/threonine protein kinase, partial [Synechocystis sp.]